MRFVLAFFVVALVAARSPIYCPGCSSGTLDDSYDKSPLVFTAHVLVISPEGIATVVVSEIFKGTEVSVQSILNVSFYCVGSGGSLLPVRVGTEGIFFTSYPSPAQRVQFIGCTRNGPITLTEKALLRNKARPQPCQTTSGQYVPEGDFVEVECNTCSCHKGQLTCTEMACEPSGDGSCVDSDMVRADGETWQLGCSKYTCSFGSVVLLDDNCSTGSVTTSRYFVIAISMAAALLVVLIATVLAVIRRRLKAQQAETNEFFGDNGSDSSDSLDDVSPAVVHGINTTANNNFSPFSGNGNAYMGTQQSQFSSFVPGWGGQPVQTTPMVLMTQTGEPVVVQVAYM
jgi:hypothetical protein